MKSSLWGMGGEAESPKPTESPARHMWNWVYRKEAHCTECIHAISPYGSWVTAVSGLLIRQKSITAGDKLQKLFFPSLLKSAKYLLKCAAHSEAKLEAAAAPSGSSRLAICSSLPQPWVLQQEGLSPQKNSHLFSFPFTFTCLATVLHGKSRRAVQLSIREVVGIISSPTTCTQQLSTSDTGVKEQRAAVVSDT